MYIVIGSEEQLIKIYDIESNTSDPVIYQETLSLTNSKGPINYFDITPDNKYIAYGSYNNKITIQSLISDEPAILLDFLEHKKNELIQEVTNNQSHIHNSDEFIPLINENKSIISSIDSLNYEDNYHFAFGSTDMYVYLYDMKEDQLNSMYNYSPVLAVKLSPDNNLILSGGYDGVTRIYDKITHNLLQTNYEFSQNYKRLETNNDLANDVDVYNSVHSIDISPSSEYIVTGHEDCTAKLWYLYWNTYSLLSYKGHTAAVKVVKISADNQFLLTGGSDGLAILWGLMSGTTLMKYQGHHSEINAVAISTNNKLVVTGSYMTVRLHDTLSGDLIKTYESLEGYQGIIRSVAFLNNSITMNLINDLDDQDEDELNKMIKDNLNIEIDQAESNEIILKNINLNQK